MGRRPAAQRVKGELVGFMYVWHEKRSKKRRKKNRVFFRVEDENGCTVGPGILELRVGDEIGYDIKTWHADGHGGREVYPNDHMTLRLTLLDPDKVT